MKKQRIVDLVKKVANPKRVPFKSLASRLTGISCPVFGVSWEPPKLEKDAIRELLVFLEDRRALYNPYELERTDWVAESVVRIREELTSCLKQLQADSEASRCVRAMRAACRTLLDKMELANALWDYRGTQKGIQEQLRDVYPSLNFPTSLGELRATFGIHIAKLCLMYGIDVEGNLTSILPAEETAKEIRDKQEVGPTTGSRRRGNPRA